jgi:hypothetical protein
VGHQTSVPTARSLGDALAALASAGTACAIVMVDGNLVHPSAPPPASWSEVRLRTAAGMVTLRRRGDEVAAVVFGNADPALLEIQARIARALAA